MAAPSHAEGRKAFPWPREVFEERSLGGLSPRAPPPCEVGALNRAHGWLVEGRANHCPIDRSPGRPPRLVRGAPDLRPLSCSYVWAGSPAHVRGAVTCRHAASKDGLQGTRQDTQGAGGTGSAVCQQRPRCYERLCLKILFKLLRINMQTTYSFMNNSILLTELFSYFHISQS